MFNENELSQIDVEIDSLVLVNTTPYTVDADGDSIISATRLSFECKYYTDKGRMSTTNEFLKFTNKIKTTDGSQDMAEDDVTIRES